LTLHTSVIFKRLFKMWTFIHLSNPFNALTVCLTVGDHDQCLSGWTALMDSMWRQARYVTCREKHTLRIVGSRKEDRVRLCPWTLREAWLQRSTSPSRGRHCKSSRKRKT